MESIDFFKVTLELFWTPEHSYESHNDTFKFEPPEITILFIVQ